MSREGPAIGEPPSQGSSPILLRSCPHSPLRRLQHCAEACSGSDHSRRPAILNKILGMIPLAPPTPSAGLLKLQVKLEALSFDQCDKQKFVA
jgi:hypothetical protein